MTQRAKRIGLWTGAVLLAPLLLLGGLAMWAGSEGSLARALQLAQRWLPEGQHLTASQVQGSLAGGGRIGELRWSRPGLAVLIHDLRLDWSLSQLLGGDLRVRRLSAALVHVGSTPQPEQPDEPFTPPSQVHLPISLALPVSVSRLELESLDETGASRLRVVEDIDAHYRYDGALHALQLTRLRAGSSEAQASATLDGSTLAVQSRLTATLRDLVADTPFAMQLAITAGGTLAGGAGAMIDLHLDARQQAAQTPAQVTVTAQIHPWRSQPAQQVDIHMDHLNLHAFHPRAPVTGLQGRIGLQPASSGASWTAAVEVLNTLPDAWDRQRLPLRQISAQAAITDAQAQIQGARVLLGDTASAGMVSLRGRVPFRDPGQLALDLELGQVNLRALLTTLPRTAFNGPANLEPAPQGHHIEARIDNAEPGPLDADRVPLDRMIVDVSQVPTRWTVRTLEAQSGTGLARLRGTVSPGQRAIDLRVELQRLPLRQLHTRLAVDPSARLSGSVSAAGAFSSGIAFNVDVGSDADASRRATSRGPWEIRSIEAVGNWSQRRLIVDRLHLDAFQSTAEGSGIDVALPGLESVQARIAASAPGIRLATEASMTPQRGDGRLSVQLTSAGQLRDWLRGLPLIGARIPELDARGAATLDATWQGTWQQWMQGLGNPRTQPRLRLDATARSDGLAFDLPSTNRRPATRLEIGRLDLQAHGNLLAATLELSASARANDRVATVDASLGTTQAGGGGTPRWDIAVDRLAASATLPGNAGPWQLQLSDNLRVTAQVGEELELRATAGSLMLRAPTGLGSEPLEVNWKPSVWRRARDGTMTVQSAGAISGLQPAWLDVLLANQGEGPLATAGMRTDLSLSAEWNASLADRIAIRARLKRDRGDLALVDADTRAGIRSFDVTIEAADENLNATFDWDTLNAGAIRARATTRFARQAGGWSLPPGAPLSGSIEAKLQDLSTLAFLAPPGWRIQGELDAGIRVSGTLGDPRFEGGIEGRTLNVRSVLDGLDLHNGTLRASIRDSRMEVAELAFEGGTGSRAYVRGFSGNRTPPPTQRGRMTARGYIDWSRVADPAGAKGGVAGSGIAMNLEAELQRMQVLVRHDRQMTLSGSLSAALEDGLLRVRGDLDVDRASIVLPEGGAPTLGDDVAITRSSNLRNAGAVEARQARAELETRRPMDMDIHLDLGRDLALEGQGITTRLEGELTVRSAPVGSDPFRVFGEVRTVEGRYRAWGQALDVETGIVRFNGPYGNPSLDLLAIRPQIEVRAGVRVTGTLLAPRVQLFSEPELPEGEKLSWVVLGRATVATGAEGSSMQQAALGLAAGQLSGRLASGLGLDELGLSESGVSVGKRVSNELYLTYQQGLAGAASTLFIFYDITRKLTLRAQASEASAVDLVYTIKFD